MSKRIQLGAWPAVMILFAMIAAPCLAADSAVLRNGFSIRFERRLDLGLVTRLYVSADGSSFVDVPTADIDHIEKAPDDAASLTTKQPAEGPKNQAPVDIDELVASASGAYRLDPDLVSSIIRAESGFNVRAVSPKGAQGLMQLMPQTASLLGVQNAFDPQANVAGGTRYLRELLERYNFDLIKALAAYNAGPRRVEQYGGVPPYYETKAYVARIVRDFNKKKLAQKNGTQTVESRKAAAASRIGTGANKALVNARKTQNSSVSEAKTGSASR
jgi:soluble lytic murein transglycosylase-like protein